MVNFMTKAALKIEINLRVTDWSNVLQYLHDGTFVYLSLGLPKLSKIIFKLLQLEKEIPSDKTETSNLQTQMRT